MKIQTWLKQSTVRLTEADINSARLDSLLLLEHQLGQTRSWSLAHQDFELSEKDVQLLNTKLAQRQQHIPLGYLLSSREFYGREFYVDSNVLIPRPESEAIITLLGEVINETTINTIFDLGTGSGCLAITSKLEYPFVHVVASDTSKAALTVARKNARKYQATIRFVESDLLQATPRMPKTRPYVILVNLPYVPAKLVTSPEITKEPAEALFSGEYGLDHYKRFWQQVANLKVQPLYIISESLESQHQKMEIFAALANYHLKKTTTLIQLFRLTE